MFCQRCPARALRALLRGLCSVQIPPCFQQPWRGSRNRPPRHHVHEQEQTRGKERWRGQCDMHPAGDKRGLGCGTASAAPAAPAGSRPRGEVGLQPIGGGVCQISVELRDEESRPGAGSLTRGRHRWDQRRARCFRRERKNNPGGRKEGGCQGEQALRGTSGALGKRWPGAGGQRRAV